MAPILPFLMEEVYQNMVREADPAAPASVHLLDYPVHDAALVDERLEQEIGAVIRYKNLGLSLRNQKNLKVRQPLEKIVVRPAGDGEREALSQPDLVAMILEELNVKRLELLEDESGLVTERLKVNYRALGPRYGDLVPRIAAHLKGLDAGVVRERLSSGSLDLQLEGRSVHLDDGDVELIREGIEGMALLYDEDAFVALSTTVTPELAREGLARDFVRHVQNLRKERGLNIEDRIHLRYRAGEEAARAITEHAGYIQTETLALSMEADDGMDEGQAKVIKLGKKRIHLDLERAPA